MSAGGASGDEYWDDDDVGYIALPVPRQDDFVLTELQLSDDEASPTRSAYGYHRFLPIDRPLTASATHGTLLLSIDHGLPGEPLSWHPAVISRLEPFQKVLASACCISILRHLIRMAQDRDE